MKKLTSQNSLNRSKQKQPIAQPANAADDSDGGHSRAGINSEAFVAHLKFVSEHHRQIEKIAIVTDSEFLKIMPHIAGLLVHPKIKQFDLGKTDEALAWLETG